jgi:hypothetical protein
MAKIECSIDTSDKSIEVKVDGKKVDNFGYMSVYSANSPYGYNFNMAAIEEMEDCTKTTYYSHSNEFVGEIDSFLRSLGTKDMDQDEMPAKKGKKKMKEGQDKKDADEMMKTDEKKKC